MAYEIPGFSYSLVAAVDLSTSLFRGVSTDANGKAVLPAAGAAIAGTCQNRPKAGEAVTVVASGIVQMEAGAAVPLLGGGVLTPVKVDATGRVIAQGGTGSAIGHALEAASAAGIIIAVRLSSDAV